MKKHVIDRYKFIDCMPVEYENSYMLIRYNPDRDLYFYCEKSLFCGNANGYISIATGKYVINKLRGLELNNTLSINIINILLRGCRNV